MDKSILTDLLKITKLASLFFSLMLLLTSCINSTAKRPKSVDRLIPDPEHHIKDTTKILKCDSNILCTGWYYVLTDTSNGCKRQLDKSNKIYSLDKIPILTVGNFTSLNVYWDSQGTPMLVMKLNEAGTNKWSIATEISIGKQLAFILDNKLLQIGTVISQVTEGVTSLLGKNYSKEELDKFKTIIESEK